MTARTQAPGAKPETSQPKNETNTNTQQPPPQPPAIPESIQKRFDEMTSRIHQMSEQYQQVVATNHDLTGTIARLTEQLTHRERPEEPLPDLPEGTDASIVNAIAARVQAPLKKELERVTAQFNAITGQLGTQQAMMELNEALRGMPDNVRKRSIELWGEVQRNKWHGAWSPQNVVTLAKGELGYTGAPAPRNEDPMLPSHGAPSPDPLEQYKNTPRKSEEEISRMSRDERVAYYAQLVGDSEIQY